MVVVVSIIGCESSRNPKDVNNEIGDQKSETKLNELKGLYSELAVQMSEMEKMNTELREELVKQQHLFELSSQAWPIAEAFMNAYIEMDYETLSSLVGDEYSINEENITYEDGSIQIPYAALKEPNLTYALNGMEYQVESEYDSILYNIVLYMNRNTENGPSDIAFLNLVLSKIHDVWVVEVIDCC